jgi:hypothetical protein
MATLFQEMIQDMDSMNKEFGYPVFTWNNATYPCIASTTNLTRDLVEGGFVLDLLLTMTVNRYTTYGQPVFPNDVIPSPQQKLTYNGNVFRIESVKTSPIYNSYEGAQSSANGATIQIIGICPNRGI